MIKRIALFSLVFTISFCFAQQTELCSKVKIWAPNHNALAEKGIWLTHAVYQREGYFEAELCGNQLDILKSSGLVYEVLIENTTEFYQNRNLFPEKQNPKNITYNCGSPTIYSTPTHFGLGSMGGFYTFAEAMAQLDSMRAIFPNLISAKTQIGLSLENRPIYAVKISDNPDVNEAENQVLYTSLHHASEPAGLQQLIFYMYYLLENYNTHPEIKYLVDHLELYFVPVVNPDGYVYNLQQSPSGGGTWRKNRRPNGLFTGVDLNRNYGYEFAYNEIGSSSLGVHPWYRGTAAFSEPESQTLKTFIEAHHFLLDLNWHSWGNFIIYPWNYESLLTPDNLLFEEFSRYLSLESHYRYGTCDQTYGYNSNGDADDWGYGEVSTKNKIISLTAEVGLSADGFWPQSTNIESLCRGALDINLRLARLGGKYALANDLSASYISSTQAIIPVEVYCLGLDVPATFSVSITPISPEIISTGSSATFNAMQTLEKRYDTLSFTIDPTTTQGTPISFSLDISNGVFIWKDTITKVFATPDTLLWDEANDLSLWTASNWSVSTESAASAPSCFTDSPGGDYGLFQTSTLQLTNAVDLTPVESAFLLFKAKWEIEKSFDWFQALASADNGATWQPLCGRYSAYGTDDQRLGEAVYDGNFTDWLQEEISLDAYIGGSVQLKFEFHSDQTHNFDGFYLDDIAVLSYTNSVSVGKTPAQYPLAAYPNPTTGLLHIDLPFPFGEAKSVVIYNCMGKLQKVENDNRLIDISGLTSGLYFIEVSNASGEKFRTKVVKE